MKRNKILAGKFNSEKYWNDDNYVILPSITSNYFENIVSTMDELLVPFCNTDDYLLTSIPMNNAHKEFLNTRGFEFENISGTNFIEKDMKIGDKIYACENSRENSLVNRKLETFAVIPCYEQFAKEMSLDYCHAPISIIKEVNSKKYSTILSRELGINNYGKIVSDYMELYDVGTEMFNQYGKIIVKEEYGVSGKGNLTINSDKELQRLFTYVKKSSKSGKKISFILEPLMKVKTDFSVQVKIEINGEVKFISIQKVLNNGFSYSGSISMDAETLELLYKKNYFEIIEKVCNRMYKGGYYGDVCIDSFITTDEQVIPIVEINARKSMSLIKNAYDKKLGVADEKELITSLFSLEFSYNNLLTFENILESMKQRDLLINDNNFIGVMPLTANTLFVNSLLKKSDNQAARGRLYFFASMLSENDILSVISRTKEMCLSFK